MASKKHREYSNSDNGVKSRMVFFRMTYQEYLSNGEVGDPYVVPHVFAIRRGSESDFYTQIGFHTTHRAKWKFTFIPVYDIVAEKRHRNFTKFFFLENTDSQRTKSMSQVAASGSQTIFGMVARFLQIQAEATTRTKWSAVYLHKRMGHVLG